MDIDTTELARQMTVLDHSLLKKLPINQLLLKKYEKPLESPNLSLISGHFNKVTGWIATEICTRPPKLGSNVICKFIDVAMVRSFSGCTHFLLDSKEIV